MLCMIFFHACTSCKLPVHNFIGEGMNMPESAVGVQWSKLYLSSTIKPSYILALLLSILEHSISSEFA